MYKIINPYESVMSLIEDQEKHYKTNLHTHSTYSDANDTIELATKSSKKIAKKLSDVSQVVGIEYDNEQIEFVEDDETA